MLTDVETRGTKHSTTHHRALLLLPNNIHLFSTFSFEGETLLLLLSFFFFQKAGLRDACTVVSPASGSGAAAHNRASLSNMLDVRTRPDVFSQCIIIIVILGLRIPIIGSPFVTLLDFPTTVCTHQSILVVLCS